MGTRILSLYYGEKPKKMSIDDVEYINMNDMESTNGRFIFGGDSSEFEFIIDKIINNKSDRLVILRDYARTQGLATDYAESHKLGEILYDSIKIPTQVEIQKYYANFLKNPVIRKELYALYREYADKMCMVPKSWNRKVNAEEITFISLPIESCAKIRSAYYKLHKDGMNLTRFAKATWYPMATLFPMLLDWSCDE